MSRCFFFRFCSVCFIFVISKSRVKFNENTALQSSSNSSSSKHNYAHYIRMLWLAMCKYAGVQLFCWSSLQLLLLFIKNIDFELFLVHSTRIMYNIRLFALFISSFPLNSSIVWRKVYDMCSVHCHNSNILGPLNLNAGCLIAKECYCEPISTMWHWVKKNVKTLNKTQRTRAWIKKNTWKNRMRPLNEGV